MRNIIYLEIIYSELKLLKVSNILYIFSKIEGFEENLITSLIIKILVDTLMITTILLHVTYYYLFSER